MNSRMSDSNQSQVKGMCHYDSPKLASLLSPNMLSLSPKMGEEGAVIFVRSFAVLMAMKSLSLICLRNYLWFELKDPSLVPRFL